MNANRSIQRELTRWIILITSVLMVIGGVVSTFVVFDETKELQDSLLHEVAILVRKGQINENFIKSEIQDNEEISILIQLVNSERNSPDTLSIPANLADGLQTLKLNGEFWRIYAVTQSTTNKQYVVAQKTEFRNDLAFSSGLNVLIPLLTLIGIMMLLIKWLVKRQFKPLNRLTKQLNQQNSRQPKLLSQENLPTEIVPFVTSINDLLDRIGKTLKKQQRFIADASHELRTPVTALSLQAENVEKALNEKDRLERQEQLKKGLIRLRSLLNQLLDLARLQSDQQNPKQPVSFKDVVLRVIEDIYPLAEKSGIDLGVLKLEDVEVLDQDGKLSQLVRNAIDNAIRYTPAKGQVDVSLAIKDGKVVLSVEDTGNGIANEDIAQVFQPFYRSQGNTQNGNGLGLAISQEIAQRLGGEIQLYNRPEGGLVFRYSQAQI